MCHKGGGDRMKYKQLSKEALVEYINVQLSKGRNFTEIARTDFEVAESTIRKYITRNGEYKRVGDRYIQGGQSVTKSASSSRQYVTETVTPEIVNDERHFVTECMTTEIEKVAVTTVNKNNSEIIIDNKYKGLITHYDILMRMAEEYVRKNNKLENQLVVKLPKENRKDLRVTFRINETVYNQFKEFVEKNDDFTVKELVSQALLEFIEKYNN